MRDLKSNPNLALAALIALAIGLSVAVRSGGKQ